MKKLTKKTLDELAIQMPVISELDQRSFMGGGDGTKSDPYTVQEYNSLLDSGMWTSGGFVFGMGFVLGEIIVTGSVSGNGSVNVSGNVSGNVSDSCTENEALYKRVVIGHQGFEYRRATTADTWTLTHTTLPESIMEDDIVKYYK